MYEELMDKYSAIYDHLTNSLSGLSEKMLQNDILLWIDAAWKAIVKYMWCDYAKLGAEYYTPVIMLSRVYITNALRQSAADNGEREVTQLTEGSRSVTFKSGVVALDSNGLTEEVKAALPPRKLRVVGYGY